MQQQHCIAHSPHPAPSPSWTVGSQRSGSFFKGIAYTVPAAENRMLAFVTFLKGEDKLPRFSPFRLFFLLGALKPRWMNHLGEACMLLSSHATAHTDSSAAHQLRNCYSSRPHCHRLVLHLLTHLSSLPVVKLGIPARRPPCPFHSCAGTQDMLDADNAIQVCAAIAKRRLLQRPPVACRVSLVLTHRHPPARLALQYGVDRNRALLAASSSGQKVYMPAETDRTVTAFWTWLQRYGGGGPPVSTLQRPIDPTYSVSRRVLLDRYSQHTVLCKDCSAAHKMLSALAVGAALLAAAAAVAALASLVAHGASMTVNLLAAGAAAGAAVWGRLQALPAAPRVLRLRPGAPQQALKCPQPYLHPSA